MLYVKFTRTTARCIDWKMSPVIDMFFTCVAMLAEVSGVNRIHAPFGLRVAQWTMPSPPVTRICPLEVNDPQRGTRRTASTRQ
jgi:hypothetical protein